MYLRRFAVAAGGSLAVSAPVAFRNVVRCEDKKPTNPTISFDSLDLSKFKMPEWVNSNNMQPLTGGLSVGGVSGIATGFTLKKIGKAVGVVFGSLYLLFQLAATYDYIKINWPVVERDITNLLDFNQDGKIDEKDLSAWYFRTISMLSKDTDDGLAAKNAAAGSFGAGFLLGFRKG